MYNEEFSDENSWLPSNYTFSLAKILHMTNKKC